MPFPFVEHCLLCEDVRVEAGNKATLLGFFGILPKVNIIILPEDEVVRLVFVVMTGKGEGEYSVTPSILSPNNTMLITGSPTRVRLHPKADGAVTGFGFMGLKIDTNGKYTFLLSVQGKEVYRTTFNIEIGPIPSFT